MPRRRLHVALFLFALLTTATPFRSEAVLLTGTGGSAWTYAGASKGTEDGYNYDPWTLGLACGGESGIVYSVDGVGASSHLQFGVGGDGGYFEARVTVWVGSDLPVAHAEADAFGEVSFIVGEPCRYELTGDRTGSGVLLAGESLRFSGDAVVGLSKAGSQTVEARIRLALTPYSLPPPAVPDAGSTALLAALDYGRRVDVLCMSTEVAGLPELVIAGMYWFYPKFGKYDELATLEVITRRGAPFMIPLDLLNYWKQKYREKGSSHPVVSTGTAALIIAAHYHEPEAITLAGFDTLMDPDKPFERNMDSPRTGKGPYVHDFHTEKPASRPPESDLWVHSGGVMIAITSFSQKGYETYGRKFLESAVKHFPGQIIVHYEEKPDSILKRT